MGVTIIDAKKTTSKLLVAFDPANPKRKSSDFLVPVVIDGKIVLFGTTSKQVVRHGMVIYTGRKVTENDLFARLVDSGCKIPVVDEALSLNSVYIDRVKAFKIGQTVEIEKGDTQIGLSLKLVQYPKAVSKRHLP